MELYLKGKTAVVTGASQGMGRAMAKELAMEGVKVLAVARNEGSLLDMVSEIRAAGGIEPVILVQDLTETDGPEKIARAALSSLEQVDILINNAGRTRPLDIIGADEEWEAALQLDFNKHRQLTQQLLPHFIERRQGAILNIASTYELRSLNASAVAKAAMVVWSKQLAAQLGKFGIRVNSLQPGLIDTNNIRPLFPGTEREKFASQEIPLGDFGQPQDIANMAVFLVSPRAGYITGSVVVVDGGMRQHPF